MIEINNTTKSVIDIKLVERVIRLFLAEHQLKKDVSLAFVSDQAMRALNKKLRDKDAVTDVLSFEGEEDFFGEIVIAYRQIERQAKVFSASAREELIFILVHALFHLLGYDDQSEAEKKEMDILGKHFIKKHSLK